MKAKFSLLATIVLLGAPLRAQEQPHPVEARLREGLRAVTLQLRDAQGQVASLQAAQLDLEAKNKALSAQLEEQAKRWGEEKQALQADLEKVRARGADQEAEITRLNVSLSKWKQGYQKLQTIAQSTEAKRAELADRVIKLDRQVADQQAKNQAMYDLGTEILTRYKKFGLGEALTAREPFVGITRVKFQNLIQDYSDKLTDTKIKP